MGRPNPCDCLCGGDVPPPPPPPSVSSNPSGSNSSSSQISISGAPCSSGNCIDEVIALRYKVTFSWSDSNRCGPAYSNQDYITYFFFNSSFCAWRSNEQAQDRAGANCLGDNGSPMFILSFHTSNLSVPGPWCNFPTAHRYNLLVNARYAAPAITDANICYASNLTNNNITVSGNPINCLSPFTLNLVSNLTTQQTWAFAVTGASTNLPPSTVTITPAP